MNVTYQRISKSWVALHPKPKGVIEFYGGQLFGQFPTVSYDYFLERLYNAGYCIIAVPFQFGLNHAEIALTLLNERNLVRQEVPAIKSLPFFWVGHSVGCKYIALLEAFTDSKNNAFKLSPQTNNNTTGILNEPSLLIAPDISDTGDSVPIPLLPTLLDTFNLGVRPSREEMQRLIVESDLFTLTAMISFNNDNVAGSITEYPEKSDVAWFYKTLRDKNADELLNNELEGDHLEPLGIEIGKTVFDITSIFDLIQEVPRQIEPTAIDLLAKLKQKSSGEKSSAAEKKAIKEDTPIRISSPKPQESITEKQPVKPAPKVEVKKEEPKIAPIPSKPAQPAPPAPAPKVEAKKEEPKIAPIPSKPAQPAPPAPAPKVEAKKEEPKIAPAPSKPAQPAPSAPAPKVEAKKEEPKIAPIPSKPAQPAPSAPAPKVEAKKEEQKKTSATPPAPVTAKEVSEKKPETVDPKQIVPPEPKSDSATEAIKPTANSQNNSKKQKIKSGQKKKKKKHRR